MSGVEAALLGVSPDVRPPDSGRQREHLSPAACHPKIQVIGPIAQGSRKPGAQCLVVFLKRSRSFLRVCCSEHQPRRLPNLMVYPSTVALPPEVGMGLKAMA